MAKKGMIEKNEKRKKLSKKFANKRTALKAIVKDTSVSAKERTEAMLKLQELPRNGSKVRIRNRCELTGRPRAYYRKFRLSRIALRELALSGQIPGVKKSSW